MKLIDILGFFGAFCTLFAFLNISHGRWSGQSYRYQLTNLLAGAILAFYAYRKHAIANIFLNIIWCAIGIYGLITVTKLSRRKSIRRSQ